MKTLVILRHADAANNSPTGRDFDRPLSEKGHLQAGHLAVWLAAEEQPVPQVVLSSPAARTRETLAVALPNAAQSAIPTSFPPELYCGGSAALIEQLESLPNDVDAVLIVGHNPTVSIIAGELLGASLPLATCALAIIDIELADWQLLRGATALLRRCVRGRRKGMDA